MARGRRRRGTGLPSGDGDRWITLAQAADRLGLRPPELRQKLDELGLPTELHPQTGTTVISRENLDALVGRERKPPVARRTTSSPAPQDATPPALPRQGTWPIEGVLEARRGVWSISFGQERRVVEVDHPAPSRLLGRRRSWLITYRGRAVPKLTTDQRSPAERRRDAERLAQGKPVAAPRPARRSVWTISGGLPGLGKRQ